MSITMKCRDARKIDQLPRLTWLSDHKSEILLFFLRVLKGYSDVLRT